MDILGLAAGRLVVEPVRIFQFPAGKDLCRLFAQPLGLETHPNRILGRGIAPIAR